MNSRIKSVFDKVHAEEELKKKTGDFLHQEIYKNKKHHIKPLIYKRIVAVAACVCLLLLGIGGYDAYFSQAYAISLDADHSVELSVNRFGKVINVQGYNKEDKEFAEALDLDLLDYEKALNVIMTDENTKQYFAANKAPSITVSGGNSAKRSEMLTKIDKCMGNGDKNKRSHCYEIDGQGADAAHKAGMSSGKYRAFLQLKKLDPNVTENEIRGLTMCQIHDRINELSVDKNGDKGKHNGGDKGHGNGGHGNGSGNENKNGSDQGSGHGNQKGHGAEGAGHGGGSGNGSGHGKDE